MKLLAFETATEACSVALYLDGEVRERFEVAPRRHVERQPFEARDDRSRGAAAHRRHRSQRREQRRGIGADELVIVAGLSIDEARLARLRSLLGGR